MYKLKKIVGTYNFSTQFIKTISLYKKIITLKAITLMYCLVVNTITVGNLCFPLPLHAVGSDLRLYDDSDLKTNTDERIWPGVASVVKPTKA